MNRIIRSFAALILLTTPFAGTVALAAVPSPSDPNVLGTARALTAAAAAVSEEDEIAIGRQLTGELLGAAPLIDDPALQHYVNRVGRRIAALSERPDLPWRFGIIDTKSVNAYSAPGGIVLVGHGLYEILENEAQLAAVLGHAIATIAKRQHIIIVRRRAAHEAMAGVFASVLAARGRDPSMTSIFTSGADLFASRLEHAAVYEADEAGFHLAARAGYNPYAFVDVLHKLAIRGPGVPSTPFSFGTHPLPSERLQKLETAATAVRAP